MKKFNIIDKSGRSAKPYNNITEEHIRKHWDVFEEDQYSGVSLYDFLEDCIEGDEYNTNEVTIICI